MLWGILALLGVLVQGADVASELEKNAYYQHLPVCSQGFDRITTRSSAKAILCPMFKDEEGFLSEWVAYYQMHGFAHIMVFDDGSTDHSLEELKPWIKSGFVSVRTNWTRESLRMSHHLKKNPFEVAMNMKALLERDCRLQALQWGYDFFYSLDIDEYAIPSRPNISIVDDLVYARDNSKRGMYCALKKNFVQTPHTLEPVHLLTIEAYQHRNPRMSKMSYYTTVADKCAYALRHTTYNPGTSNYVAHCCFFHGCDGVDRTARSKVCWDGVVGGEKDLVQKGPIRSFYDIGTINHYSRSLEKYALKAKTWRTASGEGGAEAATKYDIAGFLVRQVGWERDPIALRYSCQLREMLRQMTGEDVYLRPGYFWYRNPEFGKHVSDPAKRGRYGRPNPENFVYRDGNPLHYHGEKQQETHIQYVPTNKALLTD